VLWSKEILQEQFISHFKQKRNCGFSQEELMSLTSVFVKCIRFNINLHNRRRYGVHVKVVRLRLWTAVTNGHIVHPPGDMWALRTMVGWYRERSTPDSSTRDLWHSYQHSNLVANRRNLKMKLALRSIFVHTSKWLSKCRKILRHGGWTLYFLSEEMRAADLYRH
jgi:hypothetical protein